MWLAQEYDAEEKGVRYASTSRRRITAPDTRSRVVGYLATAPVAAPGYRTDGVWVWPEGLVAQARAGVAPQHQLYEHMRRRHFLLPEALAPATLAQAFATVHGPPTVDDPPDWAWIHLGGQPDAEGRHTALLRIRLGQDGSVVESGYGPAGWDNADAVGSRGRADRRQFVELGGLEAARLTDRLSAGIHRARLAWARESVAVGEFRLARIFDGESPHGTPWFSPARVRIPEPVRRERIVAYLRAGEPVVRGSGSVPDPFAPGERLPLDYRTDGTWVWPAATVHYVRTRGVAPELEFLCHIEEQGYRPPAVSPERVAGAAAAVLSGPPPRIDRRPPTYQWRPSGGLARAGEEPDWLDVLRDDLRWGRTQHRPATTAVRGLSEADAVAFVDARWATGHAVPPLD